MLLVMRGVPTVVNYATVLRGALGIKSQLPMRGGGGGPPPGLLLLAWSGGERALPTPVTSPLPLQVGSKNPTAHIPAF